MGTGFRPKDDGGGSGTPRPKQRSAPFAPPQVPPPVNDALPAGLLRLAVVLRMLGPRDFIAGVEREPGGVKLAGCRATDPLAAVQGAIAGAVEVMRTRLHEGRS